MGWQAGSGRGTPGHGPVAFLQSPPKLRKSQANSSALQKRVGQEHLRGQRNEVDGGVSVFDAADVSLIPTPDQQATPAH